MSTQSHPSRKSSMNNLNMFAENVSPTVQDAARALNENVATRQSNSPVVQYSNGPFFRASSLSSAGSSGLSTMSTPLPTYSFIPTPRTYTLGSFASEPESRSDSKTDFVDVRLNLICNWLFQIQLQRMWSIGENEEGVMVRKAKDKYVCCPSELSSRSGGFYEAIKQFNVKCAMTVNTRTTRLMLGLNDTPYVPLNNGLFIQVIQEMRLLPKCQKNQYAAFIQDPPVLIVWDDDPASIVDRVQELESEMMKVVWNGQEVRNQEKQVQSGMEADSASQAIDVSKEEVTTTPLRKTVLIQPLIVAVTLIVMCIAAGAGWQNIAVEIKVQKSWSCLIFPAIGPLQAWLGLFFFQTLPTCIAQIIGPVRQMRQNSKFYSGQAPPRLHGALLPHVTIQCPIYKERLSTVIEPTIKSIKAAISMYEMQGGTASIFVNDDGMQVISEEQAQERRDFYDEHNIGWVARPKHNVKCADNGKVFLRSGKFKKASNMNYGLNISIRIENKLHHIPRPYGWTPEQERVAYEEALTTVIAEDRGRTCAAGNIRIGDYILLVDSDTRVPRDCLLHAVSEMEQSPSVAIIQFSSGVMNVTESWFEKGITFFTHLVYTAIEFAVANGDVAPFVGHNAFLRWSAVQDVAKPSPDQPAYQEFWSENTVSEDFDMALRLQTSDYIVRLAAYANGGFKEGVSLTVYDELARWEKYAYGCSELIFHPFAHWIFKGPFTPLFRRFLFSNMPFHSKISIVAYIGTYFAIASSWLLTLLNYFLVGWYNGYLDHYYTDSFKIYFSTIVVFTFVGNISLAILRYRIDEKKLLPALCENLKWVPFLTIFLGGISLHVSQAIVCHLFSIDMTWGATSKEAKDTSFFHEVPTILRKFKLTFAFCFVLTGAMVVLSGVGPFQDVVPYHWQITHFTAIFPLALLVASHALLPLVLNPGLMQFTF